MIKELFQKDYNRAIETVIKADDQSQLLQEVEEYVLTNEISLKLGEFFEHYRNYEGANGVWISGFFGSGKSHLLKILSYVLENRQINGTPVGEHFAGQVADDAKLKGDIQASTRIPSESILFNIDQQAQITSKSDANALLQVFYKVLYEHQGFYGFQLHVAEFELWLKKEGKYEAFKEEFNSDFGKPWVEARRDYVDPLIEEAIARSLGKLYNTDPEKYEGILDKFEDQAKFSIEDFANKVADYINQQEKGFRLNFFIDEIGQYVVDSRNLKLNLQTIAESLATKCKGQSWILVTSQEDLESIIGDETKTQSDDFSKIQGRFRIRLPLTSANVDEVIQKRLLAKNEKGEEQLASVWEQEKDNIDTLISFSDSGIQFKSFADKDDFILKYPFIPYQFDLFQQCIKELSRHNVFQGKHASVGERSMLGVFQEVLKGLGTFNERNLISFDKLFEGLRATLRTEAQNSIILAERQLSAYPLATRILKALFLVKYYDSFKTTLRNISVLLLDSLDTNPNTHEKQVEEALNLLEQQTYIQRNGDIYEYLTDVEKDVEQEIKSTELDSTQVSDLFSELLFDGIIKENRLQFSDNKQFYEFTRKVDGRLSGREKELTIEIITPNSEHFENETYLKGQSMGNPTHMLLRLAPDSRVVKEARLFIQTDKYVRQNQSTSNTDTVKRVLFDKGQQNQERKRELIATLDDLLARSTVYLNGSEHKVSSTGDGKTKVIYAFQDLIRLAYSKLKLLGETHFDETRLQNIMRGHQDDLFGEDDSSMTAAESEVLQFLQRQKKMNERTTLTDLKEQFSRKPYGWPNNAVWCMVALLFKRGKVEAIQDSVRLEDKEFREALMNTRTHSNTLVAPQIEFDQSQIRKLKDIHQQAFDESNPHQEAKEVAQYFKDKVAEELKTVSDFLAQQETYPFLKQLSPLAEILNSLNQMDYAGLITRIEEMEDDLLDLKEDVLDPIKQFMNSEQKNIFDRAKEFRSLNQANFAYVDASEKELVKQVLEDSAPYRGHLIREAKQAMDTLENRVKNELLGEREQTGEKIQEKMGLLKQREEMASVSEEQRSEILQPFEELEEQAKQERFIGNLRDMRTRVEDLYTRQLNKLMQFAAPQENGEAKTEFIKQNNIDVEFNKKELESEEDVEAYAEATKEALLQHIRKNRKIILS